MRTSLVNLWRSSAALRTAAAALLFGVGCYAGLLLTFILTFPHARDALLWLPAILLLAASAVLALVLREWRRVIRSLRHNEAALRDGNEQVRELAGRLIAAQEAERTRLAGELHDDINQQLAALSIALSGLKRRLPTSSGDLAEEVAGLQRRVAGLADDIRHLSHELHPGVLRHAGLVAALQAHCEEFHSRSGVETTFQASAGLDAVPAELALCLYRVAQEALHNVTRHAKARHVRVVVSGSNDRLELTVTDDGQGFDVQDSRRAGGLGLISLDERVRLAGGTVRIDARPQWGTELHVQLPLGENYHVARESVARG